MQRGLETFWCHCFCCVALQTELKHQMRKCDFSLPQGFMFGKSGEILTMRLRSLSFKALLQQVWIMQLGYHESQMAFANLHGTHWGLILWSGEKKTKTHLFYHHLREKLQLFWKCPATCAVGLSAATANSLIFEGVSLHMCLLLAC